MSVPLIPAAAARRADDLAHGVGVKALAPDRHAPGLEVLQVRLVSAERGRGIGGGLIGLGFGHRQGSTGPGWFLVRWQAGKLAGPGCMFAIVVHAVSRFPKEANRQSTNINTWEGALSRVDSQS
jgi:hypothetical protein